MQVSVCVFGRERGGEFGSTGESSGRICQYGDVAARDEVFEVRQHVDDCCRFGVDALFLGGVETAAKKSRSLEFRWRARGHLENDGPVACGAGVSDDDYARVHPDGGGGDGAQWDDWRVVDERLKNLGRALCPEIPPFGPRAPHAGGSGLADCSDPCFEWRGSCGEEVQPPQKQSRVGIGDGRTGLHCLQGARN